jgi:hypothetical protein
MKLTITGPNTHGGMFHVHRTDCADLNKRPYSGMRGFYSERYEEEHPDVQSVVLSVYDNGIMDEQDSPCSYQDFLGEFHFFPCTNDLPEIVGELELRSVR